MTSQTREFIELSDIAALKLECKLCGSKLTIPSSRRLGLEDVGKLSTCPICLRPWSGISGSSYEPLIAQFVSVLNDLRDSLKNSKPDFSLVLEMEPEED